MLFQTQAFVLVFLPLALLAYWCAASRPALRQWILIFASLAFYAYWDWRFVPLLLAQITLTWWLGRISRNGTRHWPITMGIILNLSSLATFKYLDFFAEAVGLPLAHIILPIGISFFSFQLISFLIDMRRGEGCDYHWREFALFVLFFPHLIAGPIVRHQELIPQFALDPRRPGMMHRAASGGVLFILGMAKKLFLADRLARFVDPLFLQAGHSPLGFSSAWIATLGFSLQLFLDFSAYTDMATGIALMFGLLLPENFNQPYRATNLQDFWRRWHISLSKFIRDYLYIPVGGSRHGTIRYAIATLGSMALCGLWHGAGWNYVLWGLWHGIGLIIHRAWRTLNRPLPAMLGWIITMVFVMFGWVIFRTKSIDATTDLFASLIGKNTGFTHFEHLPLLLCAGIVALFLPSAHHIKDNIRIAHPAVGVALGLLAVYCLLMVGVGAPVNFIYFKF